MNRSKKEIICRDDAKKLLEKLPMETAVRVYKVVPTELLEGHLMLCVDLEMKREEKEE